MSAQDVQYAEATVLSPVQLTILRLLFLEAASSQMGIGSGLGLTSRRSRLEVHRTVENQLPRCSNFNIRGRIYGPLSTLFSVQGHYSKDPHFATSPLTGYC